MCMTEPRGLVFRRNREGCCRATPLLGCYPIGTPTNRHSCRCMQSEAKEAVVGEAVVEGWFRNWNRDRSDLWFRLCKLRGRRPRMSS